MSVEFRPLSTQVLRALELHKNLNPTDTSWLTFNHYRICLNFHSVKLSLLLWLSCHPRKFHPTKI